MAENQERRHIPKSETAELTDEENEKKLASQRGIYSSAAGLPDEDAIKDAFGITKEDLYPDKTRRSYKGKRRKRNLSSNASDWFGRHDETGADIS